MCHPNCRKKLITHGFIENFWVLLFWKVLKRSSFIITYYEKVTIEIFSKLTIKIYKDLWNEYTRK